MSNGREDQNSSCALFLSIVFVLMLLGSEKDTSRARQLQDQATSTTTPNPNLVSENYTFVDGYDRGHHSHAQSAKVVVLLFSTLMLVQMLGFCFVIALRRRALQNQASTEYSGTQLTRGGDGWGMYDEDDADENNVIDPHPILASFNAAAEDPDLPSYDETMQEEEDPGLPSYFDAVEEPGPMAASLSERGAEPSLATQGVETSIAMPTSPPRGHSGTGGMPMNSGSLFVESDNDEYGDDAPLIASSSSRS
eukprot:m.61237 g.61237  ORF g.61237 m.61237 type:complete len:251 (-) comp8011_c0_seq1:47-799(-)